MLLVGVALMMVGMHLSAATLDEEIELIWGASHTYFFMDGETETLALSLDEQQGSCFRSKDMYLYGTISMDIKLVEGNSAGVVATAYVRSRSPAALVSQGVAGLPCQSSSLISSSTLSFQKQKFTGRDAHGACMHMPVRFQRRDLEMHACTCMHASVRRRGDKERIDFLLTRTWNLSMRARALVCALHLHADHLRRPVVVSRRDRPGVPRQPNRPANRPPHQHLRQRRRRPGAAVLPPVRPHRRLPHLHHRVEPQVHPVSIYYTYLACRCIFRFITFSYWIDLSFNL